MIFFGCITQDILADPDIRDKLIYVDPARTDYVIPFNVLDTDADHPYDVAAARPGSLSPHLDFRAIMDEGKVLLLDLGHSDSETNRLIGSLVVTSLELAMRRRRRNRQRRRPRRHP